MKLFVHEEYTPKGEMVVMKTERQVHKEMREFAKENSFEYGEFPEMEADYMNIHSAHILQ